MSDNLEEFFDFAQLEQDNGLYSAYPEGHREEVAHAEGVICMDWQPVLSDYNPPPEEQVKVQQWSLDGIVNQSLTHSNLHAMSPEWSTNPTPITNEHQQLHGLAPAPSSSLQVSDSFIPSAGVPYYDPALSSGQINGAPATSYGPLDKNAFDTSDVRATHPVPPKASPPTRRTSSASWKPASAKRKGPQSRIPLESRQILEDEFATNPYPCSWEYDIIAHQANLDVKKVRNWFNNTRARKKGEGKLAQIPQRSTICSPA